MKRPYLVLLAGILLPILLAACELPLFGEAAVQATATIEAQQHFIETESVAMVNTTIAQIATQTALAIPTATPTITPTSTPLPTATATPGPLVIDDDFSTLDARWQGCDVCSIKDGALVMGPYPSADSAQGYITLCKDCGIVHEYKMSVDATFVSGVSDRGFGFLVREWDGNFIDLEITTWQLYGLWYYDSEGGKAFTAWHSLLSKAYLPTGYLRPGLIKNHIDIEVVASDANKEKDLIKISFNGTLLNTIEVPTGAGRVGLAVGLHSIGVAFDNFHFEGMPLISTTDDSSG
jgi:hypothetical protein